MARDHDHSNWEEDPSEPSRSQRKREARAVKGVGERLVELPAELLARVPLDDDLRNAIREARRLPRGSALKRQIQYVAKLLRASDTTEIEEALERFAGQSRKGAQQLHRIETWRDGLLDNDKDVLAQLFSAHPGLDRQHLNALVRQAQRERDLGSGEVTHYRKLFRFLRELEEGDGIEP